MQKWNISESPEVMKVLSVGRAYRHREGRQRIYDAILSAVTETDVYCIYEKDYVSSTLR